MFTSDFHNISQDTLWIKGLFKNHVPLTCHDVLGLLEEDSGFRRFFESIMLDCRYSAFCFETPPLNTGSATRPFECVLVNSPILASSQPDYRPFEDKFRLASPDQSIVSFKNLSKDATLVVPCLTASQTDYTHLKNFLKNAPEPARDEFWQLTATIASANISDRPLWLSTAGLGVLWLHMRISTKPKYYRHHSYTRLPS